MAGAVRAVGGAVGGLVGLIGGGIKLAFGLIGGVFGSLLKPELPDTSSLGTGHQDLRTESNAPRLMIVGKTVTSGPITKYQKRTLNKKEYNLFFTPLAAHPCESVDLYQLDGKETSSLSGEGYRIQVALGEQTTANSTARAEMTNVDENCVGFGITYAYHKYEVNPDIFPNGVQDVKFLVAGIKCYDPRKDTSVGGSGTHRADDESTWEWTENPVLINLYWKRFGGDEVLPIEMFDMANLAFEANLCDEEVTFADKNGDTFTEKRWTCNGVIDLSQGQRIVEEELLKSCGATRWLEAGGKYWLLTATYRGPATVTLTDDDLKADVERQPYTPLEDRCNAVVAKFIDPESFYQETNSTEIYSEYYRDTRDKKYLQHARQLGFTNTDTMCQRLNRMYMEQLAAGDTLKVVVGWKGIKCSPGKVVNIEFKEHNILGKEYEVIDFEFNVDTFTWSLILQETASEIYDDSVIPAERDLTPNTDIDNTFVEAPQNVSYSPTPGDAFRQGVITWEHDAPDSVRRYVVLITKQPADSFSQVYYPTQPAQDVNNLPLGNYIVAIAAQNRFEKNSVATSIPFNVGATSTPTEDIRISILPGRVIVTGPTPPNARATYEWKFSFNGAEQTHFDDAIEGGRNLTITITNTPHNGSVTVWYRLVNDTAADPNWLSVTIANLIGVNKGQYDPIEFYEVMRPALQVLEFDIEELQLNFDDIDSRFIDFSNRFEEFEAQTLAIQKQEQITREQAEALLLQSISENAAYQLELARRVEAGEELTNAVVYRDPQNGLIVNRAYQYADNKFTEAALIIDGVEGEVNAAVQRIENTENQVTNLSSELALIPGAITATATAIVSESLSALEPAHAFNFFDSAQGWQAVNGTLAAGVNEITVTHGDIENDTLDYLASENKLIRVSIERLAGNGWSGTVIIEKDDATVETYANYIDESSILLIDFSALSSYSGTINRVRLVFGESTDDEFKITSIVIGKADATTQDLANITARVTQAEIDISANDAAITQRVTTSFFESNAITFSNVEQTINALDSIIALEATRQQLIEDDVITKANSAAIFINGATGSIQQLVQDFEQGIDAVETSIIDVQQQINGLGISEQVAGLASAQIQTYDAQAGLLQQAVNDLSGYLANAENEQSVALAVNQLQIDVSPEGSLANDISSLQSATVANGDAITATNQRLSQVETDATGNASAIEQLNLDVSGINTALAGSLSRIDAVEIDANQNATALSALQGRATSIEGDVESNFALATEAKSTADGNASTINQVQIDVLGLNSSLSSAVTRIDSVEVDAENNATAISALQGKATSFEGDISANFALAQQAKTTADNNALAISSLEAAVNNATTGLSATNTLAQQASTTASDADGKADSNATAIQQLTNTVEDENSGLSATNAIAQQAKITADDADGKADANATAITSISSRVTGAEDNATAALTLVSGLDSELDEYRAIAQLAVDSNGNVSLIQLDATPSISQILFKAAQLSMIDQDNTPRVFWDAAKGTFVFNGEVRAEAGYFKGVLKSAKTENIGSNFMELSDPDGFGPDNLSYYFGPKFMSGGSVNYSLANKANANQWRDTSGNLYTGGTLSAGVISNAARSTTVSENPSTVLGPFSSNGNPKNVVFSYDYSANSTVSGQCQAYPATPSCTVQLEKKTGTGNWQLLQTKYVTGGSNQFYEPELGGCVTGEDMSGSWTYTDTSTATANITYRVVVSNTVRYHEDRFVDSQVVSITSVEE